MTARLVLATRNAHKVGELADILRATGAGRRAGAAARTTHPTSSRTG